MDRSRDQIRSIALTLRAALSRALSSSKAALRTAPEIHKSLGIDRKLAWKISRFLCEEDIYLALTHFPGKAAFQSLLKTLTEKGIPVEDITSLRDYFNQLMGIVSSHADSRASFDLMLASLSDSGMLHAYRSRQRMQFQANSYLLGIQSRAQFSTWFLHPSSVNESRVDVASLRGIIDLQRNRPRAPFTLQSIHHRSDPEAGDIQFKSIPVDNSAAKDSPDLAFCSLLGEFCTKPLPEILHVEKNGDEWKVQLSDGPVGKSGLVSLVSADLFPENEPRWHCDSYPEWEFQTRIKSPTEVFIGDFFIHESLLAESNPTMRVCQDFTDLRITVPFNERSPETEIPCDASLNYIGKGLESVYTPLLPDYHRMVSMVLQKADWQISEIILFRIVIEFPVTPSSVYISSAVPRGKKEARSD